VQSRDWIALEQSLATANDGQHRKYRLEIELSSADRPVSVDSVEKLRAEALFPGPSGRVGWCF
jgi:hypothetical protein